MARLPWRRPASHGTDPPAGGHGGARCPESRAYAYLEGNVVHHIPVLAGQGIRCGDIVTQVGDRAARVHGVSEEGDGANWGDVGEGAYVALATVDASGASGDRTVPVYTYGAVVEVILDGGIVPGSRVGVDLRDCVGGRRADRSAPARAPSPGGHDAELWRRVRAMAPGDIADPKRGRALLGTVVRVSPTGGDRRQASRCGDLGAVVIEVQR